MSIDGTTGILGIIGFPLSHTLSPLIQNAALEYLGLNIVYLPFEVNPTLLGEALKAIVTLNILGVNVTIPYKEEVAKYLDEWDEESRLIKAVNTIKNSNGRLLGFNTDSKGFLMALTESLEFHPRKKDILIVGAGGAARAVIVSLAKERAGSITIANRTVPKALKLISEFKEIFRETDFAALDLQEVKTGKFFKENRIDLLVNATSVGIKGETLGLPLKDLSNSTKILDLVYSPSRTPLVIEAQSYGLSSQDGSEMLIYQGALSFEIWTELKAPLFIMRKALKAKQEKDF